MTFLRRLLPVLNAGVLSLVTVIPAAGADRRTNGFTMEQMKSYPFPNELAAASKANRIAWALNEQGKRNIYVAEGPAYAARRLTNYNRICTGPRPGASFFSPTTTAGLTCIQSLSTAANHCC